MKRTKFKIKLIIDIAMIISFLINMFTGLAIFFGIVSNGGQRQNRGFNAFNIESTASIGTKAIFKLIHDWSGIIVIILILIHLTLNWDTFWCYLKNSFVNLKNSKEKNTKLKCEINAQNK